METDPVCGMEVDPHDAKHKIDESGVTRYFCSESCRDRYTTKNKGWFTRLLEWIARGNREKYGDNKPSCCGG